jgi:hypothetical protein
LLTNLTIDFHMFDAVSSPSSVCARLPHTRSRSLSNSTCKSEMLGVSSAGFHNPAFMSLSLVDRSQILWRSYTPAYDCKKFPRNFDDGAAVGIGVIVDDLATVALLPCDCCDCRHYRCQAEARGR